MADQRIGTIANVLDRTESRNTPAVKIVVGHERPKVGIFSRLSWSTALMTGYSSE
jgi:hypothetical protein